MDEPRNSTSHKILIENILRYAKDYDENSDTLTFNKEELLNNAVCEAFIFGMLTIHANYAVVVTTSARSLDSQIEAGELPHGLSEDTAVALREAYIKTLFIINDMIDTIASEMNYEATGVLKNIGRSVAEEVNSTTMNGVGVTDTVN